MSTPADKTPAATSSTTNTAGYSWRGRQLTDIYVSVTVPQINNGVSTLVVFAVPMAAERAHGGGPWTFEQADAVAAGPPLVITADEFNATDD
jgi:hypothetical protein